MKWVYKYHSPPGVEIYDEGGLFFFTMDTNFCYYGFFWIGTSALGSGFNVTISHAAFQDTLHTPLQTAGSHRTSMDDDYTVFLTLLTFSFQSVSALDFMVYFFAEIIFT